MKNADCCALQSSNPGLDFGACATFARSCPHGHRSLEQTEVKKVFFKQESAKLTSGALFASPTRISVVVHDNFCRKVVLRNTEGSILNFQNFEEGEDYTSG